MAGQIRAVLAGWLASGWGFSVAAAHRNSKAKMVVCILYMYKATRNQERLAAPALSTGSNCRNHWNSCRFLLSVLLANPQTCWSKPLQARNVNRLTDRHQKVGMV